ncbi:MAG: LptA/OstA family protein [candidate division WOR-3 bacterium]
MKLISWSGIERLKQFEALKPIPPILAIAINILLLAVANAADIEANKMEILNTEEGRVTVLSNGVTIIDRDTKITANSARFWESKNLVILADSIKIENPSATIRSDTANYYLTERKTILKGNVLVAQESLAIFAPQLTVEYQKDRAYTQAGFVIVEKTHSLKITGKTGEYLFNQEVGRVDSLPYLEFTKNETLALSCQKLLFKNKAKLAIAIGKVKVQSKEAILTCDSLIYFWERDSGVAYQKPMLKEKNNELSGQTMVFLAQDSELKQIEIVGDASGQYYNEEGDKVEISGSNLSLRFAEGKIYSILVKDVKYGKLYRGKS